MIPNGFLFQPTLSPYRIDRGINEQFENEGGEDTADHRSGHPLQDFRTGSVGHRMGIKPMRMVANVMNLRGKRRAAPSTIAS